MLKSGVSCRQISNILICITQLGAFGVRAARAQVIDQTRFFAADGWEFGSALASSGSTLVVGDEYWNINPSRNTVGNGYVFTLTNGQWTQQAELTASDGRAYDLFGSSVAVSGSLVTVGAPDHAKTGAVYLFTQNKGKWTQTQEITPADGQSGDNFGYSIAMTSTTLAVGACRKGGYAGAVYLYTLSGGKWKLQVELPAPNVTAGSHNLFGYSVALSGSDLLVGAPAQNASAGAAYVYASSGGKWTQQAELTPSGATGPAQFGWSVALYGNVAAVGAPDVSTVTLYQSGTGGWSQQAVLNAFEGASITGFGTALAMNSTTLVVSAVNVNDQSTYVFTLGKSGWTPQNEFVPFDDTFNDDQFGVAVALVGNEAVVARPHSWDGTPSPTTPLGAVYAFTVSGAEAQAADGRYGDDYGYAVALAGTTALAGAPGRNGDTGAVYAYTLSGNSLKSQTILTVGNGQAGDGFGTTLAFDGVTLVVGAPLAANGQGAIYVYTDSAGAWTFQTELTAGDGQFGDGLGEAVSLSGSQILVGAPGRNGNTGGAYVFALNVGAWSQQAELIAGDGQAEDEFGTSVALSGSSLVIGSPNATTTTAIEAGAAYVYTQSGGQWSPVTKLSALDGQFGDQFGYSVALSGGQIAVGAPNNSYYAGAIYAYLQNANQWQLQQKLAGLCIGPTEQFGWTLALSGNTLLVGDSGHDTDTGDVVLFTQVGGLWILTGGLTAADGQELDSFSTSIALSGSTVAIGAPYTNSGSGSLYVH